MAAMQRSCYQLFMTVHRRSLFTAPLGDVLRELRGARGVSQLELALRCEISPRHLSFVETGKSQPSREIIERIGEELELSLRERNGLHLAAGYAPRYRETPLDAPELAIIREAIEATLAQQLPYPAFVADRHWNIVMANAGMATLMRALRPEGLAHDNVLRQLFDPTDLRPFVVNWEEVAGDLLRHFRYDVMRSPFDAEGRALLDEVLAYPDIPTHWRRLDLSDAPLPMLRTVFALPEGQLSFLSTIAQFGTAWDLTVQEVRVEAMHPTDDFTRDWFQAR
ncbi:helix-turn-helix domain-containing protein [Rhizorhabdus histidinilytica]|uniref:helix-turn-helix domain-containing protein n=1 Tax=Rhizorhabdus histidinilytica TaxID=439228 RepID=UPI001AD9B197|nr:helix-turn-helix transcriptional regulator [Rhizorhabdus histidinilytica]